MKVEKYPMSIDELEKELKSMTLYPVRLSIECDVVDTRSFVDLHLKYLRSNPGNPAYLPYYERLVEYYNLLKSQK